MYAKSYLTNIQVIKYYAMNMRYYKLLRVESVYYKSFGTNLGPKLVFGSKKFLSLPKRNLQL